jgi:uncharacterized membrane protein YsdA (DUF1294 family)
MRRHPYLWFGLITLALSGGLAYFLWRNITAIDEVGAWLLAINFVALVTFAYDKFIAGSGATRVPERILLLLVALGGCVGGLIGIVKGRHKTQHTEFQFWFVVCTVISIGLGVAYFQMIRPVLGG